MGIDAAGGYVLSCRIVEQMKREPGPFQLKERARLGSAERLGAVAKRERGWPSTSP